MNDFEQELKIDLNTLEFEFMDQPIKVKKWGDLATDAEFIKNRAKDYLGQVIAETELDIRRNPDKYDIPKITDKLVATVALTIDVVKDAQLKYAETLRDLGNLKNSTNSLEHRRSSLKHLMESWQQGYWSTDMKMGPNTTITTTSDTQMNDQLDKHLKRS